MRLWVHEEVGEREVREGGRREGGGRELSEGRKEMSAGHQTIQTVTSL